MTAVTALCPLACSDTAGRCQECHPAHKTVPVIRKILFRKVEREIQFGSGLEKAITTEMAVATGYLSHTTDEIITTEP